MFGFLGDVGQSIANGVHDVGQSISNGVHSAEASVGNWLGHGADASSPVTTAGASQHAEAAQPSTMWGQIGQGIGDIGRGLSQEGISGLLDPRGMMDRQQAQRDLASRFQVMPASFVGPTRDNQVSQEEFQKIAHTFSDVRMGRGDLHVDTSSFDGANAKADAARYRTGAMDDIANMMMTSSGRNQINNLSNNVKQDDAGNAQHTGLFGAGTSWFGPEVHHQTNIVPLFGANGGVDAQGNTIWNDPGAGHHDWSTMRTDNGYADAVDTTNMQRTASGARGTGTDVNIRFNPEANNIAGTGARSDVILAHEMQHTLHETQGTMASGTQTTGPDTGTQNWERQAVGLTRTDRTPTGGHYPGDPDGCTENTYRQQRNDLGLGERWLPREAYATLPGQAADDATLQAAWARHNASGNAAP